MKKEDCILFSGGIKGAEAAHACLSVLSPTPPVEVAA